MVVDAEVFYWTEGGMHRRPSLGGPRERYIRVTDAERLLEEAHRRGSDQKTEEYMQRMAALARSIPI